MMIVIELWSVRKRVLHLAFWVAYSLMDVNQHLVARGFMGFACRGTVTWVPQLSAWQDASSEKVGARSPFSK